MPRALIAQCAFQMHAYQSLCLFRQCSSPHLQLYSPSLLGNVTALSLALFAMYGVSFTVEIGPHRFCFVCRCITNVINPTQTSMYFVGAFFGVLFSVLLGSVARALVGVRARLAALLGAARLVVASVLAVLAAGRAPVLLLAGRPGRGWRLGLARLCWRRRGSARRAVAAGSARLSAGALTAAADPAFRIKPRFVSSPSCSTSFFNDLYLSSSNGNHHSLNLLDLLSDNLDNG